MKKERGGGGEPIRYAISIDYPIEHWIKAYVLIRQIMIAL